MSEEEREKPEILYSRAFKAKQRIAEVSGSTVEELNRLVCVNSSITPIIEKIFL